MARRILLIEDDYGRASKIQGWVPTDIRVVHAVSAGRAIGILQRYRNAYAGIILDHDLQGSAATEMDEYLSGSNVVKAIIATTSPEIPILVHSMSREGAPKMVKELEKPVSVWLESPWAS